MILQYYVVRLSHHLVTLWKEVEMHLLAIRPKDSKDPDLLGIFGLADPLDLCQTLVILTIADVVKSKGFFVRKKS